MIFFCGNILIFTMSADQQLILVYLIHGSVFTHFTSWNSLILFLEMKLELFSSTAGSDLVLTVRIRTRPGSEGRSSCWQVDNWFTSVRAFLPGGRVQTQSGLQEHGAGPDTRAWNRYRSSPRYLNSHSHTFTVGDPFTQNLIEKTRNMWKMKTKLFHLINN